MGHCPVRMNRKQENKMTDGFLPDSPKILLSLANEKLFPQTLKVLTNPSFAGKLVFRMSRELLEM